jgi:hypothetical protein
MVPSEEAEKTTPRQVNRRGWQSIHAVDLTVATSYPTLPSLAPGSGLTLITLVSGKSRAPCFSASRLRRRDPGRSDCPVPLLQSSFNFSTEYSTSPLRAVTILPLRDFHGFSRAAGPKGQARRCRRW